MKETNTKMEKTTIELGFKKINPNAFELLKLLIGTNSLSPLCNMEKISMIYGDGEIFYKGVYNDDEVIFTGLDMECIIKLIILSDVLDGNKK